MLFSIISLRVIFLVRFTVVAVCLYKTFSLIFIIEFCVSHRINFAIIHDIGLSGLGVLRRVIILPFKKIKAADCGRVIHRLYFFARALF